MFAGMDLDTQEYGSGFPRPGEDLPPPPAAEEGEDEGEEADPLLAAAAVLAAAEAAAQYASHAWNLNNLQGSSLLRYLPAPESAAEDAEESSADEEGADGDVVVAEADVQPGVAAPALRVGMMFSACPWRVEEHLLYSASYLHCGEARRWYSVPASASAAFEQAFQAAVPDQFASQPDLLFQPSTLLTPRTLRQADVPVFSVVQEPGQFVIAFPGAYTASFDHGLCVAESAAFAPPDWLRFAAASTQRYRHYRRPPVRLPGP